MHPHAPHVGLSLDRAVDLTRTGDVWLFRGRTVADRAIRAATNAPVNHVGMAVVLDDMPPLLWHAELGRSLPDVWSGHHQRGVQLHVLRDAVTTWHDRYRQRPYLRQLDPAVGPDAEDAVLRTIGRLDGTPFPSTVAMGRRWLAGRARHGASLEQVYCAELVAATYQAMGLLPATRPVNWFDPGSFWSGDRLDLVAPFRLGTEIEVDVLTGTRVAHPDPSPEPGPGVLQRVKRGLVSTQGRVRTMGRG